MKTVQLNYAADRRLCEMWHGFKQMNVGLYHARSLFLAECRGLVILEQREGNVILLYYFDQPWTIFIQSCNSGSIYWLSLNVDKYCKTWLELQKYSCIHTTWIKEKLIKDWIWQRARKVGKNLKYRGSNLGLKASGTKTQI